MNALNLVDRIEIRPIGELIAYAKNLRIHSKDPNIAVRHAQSRPPPAYAISGIAAEPLYSFSPLSIQRVGPERRSDPGSEGLLGSNLTKKEFMKNTTSDRRVASIAAGRNNFDVNLGGKQ